MGSDAIVITIMIIFAIVMLILHSVANVRERGQSPHWAAEVYFYDGGSLPLQNQEGPPYVAAGPGPHAVVATPAQVEVYLAEAYGRGGATLSPRFDRGVWLYGAKPRRGTVGVYPFNNAHWFHPSVVHTPVPPV